MIRMQTNHEVLFEIGVEELPARFIDRAEKELADRTVAWLKEERIGFEEVMTFSTPRRLAIRIKGIDEEQETVVEKVRGPNLDIAKDAEGNWSKAAIGFTKGQGKTVDDITIEEVKGVSYTFVEKKTEGKPTIDVLANFADIIASIPFQQTMRWGEKTFRFARPIRWLVAMMDDQVIPFEIAGVHTGNETMGHRFLAGKVTLNNPSEYETTLEKQYVIANPKKRKQMIVDQIKQIEEAEDFHIEMNDSLLNEVCNLVEYPTAFHGEYDADYLSLPEEVLITSMREHQRYFPVFQDESKEQLLPYFVSVRNGDAHAIDNVVQGNEKVLRARLADGRFFYDEDRNSSIDSYVEKLKSVIFQEELGTIYDKSIRVQKIAAKISELLEVSEAEKRTINRAAKISKFDLVTNMVNEFPELQGIIGENYARHFDEDDLVSTAVREHYKPVHATDSLPTNKVSSIVSVADKLDTVVGTISIGLIPTGSQDPYGLRRQAIGILRIMLENKWDIPFESFLKIAEDLFENNEHKAAIMNFFKDRAIYIFNKENVENDIIDAVLHDEIGVLSYKLAKAKLLSAKRNDSSFKLVQESFVRVLNLADKAKDKAIDTDVFKTPSEEALYNQLVIAKDNFDRYETAFDAESGLEELITLAEPIHQFFENNMVMDPNETLKENRLALVHETARLIKRFADLTLIEWRRQG